VAEKDVTVELGTGRITCDRSAYDATTGVIEMTGQPAWRFADKDGTSDLLRLDVSNQVYRAEGNVRMKGGRASLGSSSWLSPQQASSNRASAGAKTGDAASDPPVEIACDEFEFRSAAAPDGFDQAVYRYHVRVNQGEEMNLVCDRIVASLLAGTNQVVRMVADGGVRMQSKAPGSDRVARGETIVYTAAQNRIEMTGPAGVEIEMTDEAGHSTARGKRAVYDGDRDLLELDGMPVLTAPQGTLTGTVVRWDRSHSTFTASGHWKLRLPAKALAGRMPGDSP
jgi:lipopolysaccharide export system protein LptA